MCTTIKSCKVLQCTKHNATTPSILVRYTLCTASSPSPLPCLNLRFTNFQKFTGMFVFFLFCLWPVCHYSQSTQGDQQRQRTFTRKVPQHHCTLPGPRETWLSGPELRSDYEASTEAGGTGIPVEEDEPVCTRWEGGTR